MSIYDSAYRKFLDRLKGARSAANISQEQLAGKLRKHQTYVSKVEKGQRYLNVLEYLLWARELGIDPIDPITDLAAEIEQRRPRTRRVIVDN